MSQTVKAYLILGGLFGAGFATGYISSEAINAFRFRRGWSKLMMRWMLENEEKKTEEGETTYDEETSVES